MCAVYLVGPMIIYEYCEQGPLKDYLQGHASNATLEVQEQLFRFGLDIAKGMEYLASKKVTKIKYFTQTLIEASILFFS